MADSNLLKRFMDAGMAFTQLTQARAEAIVKDLVSAGEVQTGQASATVQELIDRSRENTERLVGQFRGDIRSQIGNLGLATKADIARLERKISSLSSPAGGTSQPAKKAAKKSSTKSAKGTTKKAAKRTPAKAAAKKR